jgi:hypothetical protein
MEGLSIGLIVGAGRLSMQVGDLVKVDSIGAGIVTDVYWDDEEGSEYVRIQFMDGTWSLENEDIVEMINASR